MEIVDLTALLLSFVGLQLTYAKFIFYLKPTDRDPRKERTPLVHQMFGGSEVEEKLEDYIERRHQNDTSRVGSFFILLSVVVQPIPISAKVKYSHWGLLALLLLFVTLLSVMLAWDISNYWTNRIKDEAREEKDRWETKLEDRQIEFKPDSLLQVVKKWFATKT